MPAGCADACKPKVCRRWKPAPGERPLEGISSKYPPAKPGALECEPLKAAAGSLARPRKTVRAAASWVPTHRLRTATTGSAPITTPEITSADPSEAVQPYMQLPRRARPSGANRVSAHETTAGNVKLLLPPRQSRGISHFGLGTTSRHRAAQLPDWASCRKNVRKDAKRGGLDV
jgi:hypothetical protein